MTVFSNPLFLFSFMTMKEFIYPIYMEICVTAEDVRVREVTKKQRRYWDPHVHYRSPIIVHNIVQTRSFILTLCYISNSIIQLQNLTKTAQLVEDFELET